MSYLRAAVAFLIGLSSLAFATRATADAPPPLERLREIARVVYTDLPNRNPLGDCPDRVIADAAAAKTQMFFSRVHSGEEWQGLGWESDYGDPDPLMKGGDGTRHVVELCHRYGIRYMGYYWVQREPATVGQTHFDLKCVTCHGKSTGTL